MGPGGGLPAGEGGGEEGEAEQAAKREQPDEVAGGGGSAPQAEEAGAGRGQEQHALDRDIRQQRDPAQHEESRHGHGSPSLARAITWASRSNSASESRD